MKKFKNSLNSNGLTLIEVLAATLLLGIVLISLMSFLGQSLFFSQKVEDNLSAVNIADKVLYEFKENMGASLTGQSCPSTNPIDLAFLPKDSDNRYFYEINNKKYYPVITVCQSDNEKTLDLYRVHITILDKDKKLLSELIDYMEEG